MTARKPRATARQKLLFTYLRELRMMLHEIDQKLDHLIQSCRRFYFTDDFSFHSSNHEFKG